MWWSRKLASRCLRLNRAKSTSTSKEPEQTLGIIGVPFAKGQGKQGVELAPDLLRQSSLRQVLQSSHDGLVIRDYGNLQYAVDEPLLQQQRVHYHHIRNYADFMACNRALIEQVKLMLAENSQFLAIGGDHAIGFGSVAGHLQHTPNLSLVWIDAHADINLHSTSQSGNIHGMPVSFLLEQLRTTWQHAGLQDIAPNCHGRNKTQTTTAWRYNKAGLKKQAQHKITTKLGNSMGWDGLLFFSRLEGEGLRKSSCPPLALHKHLAELNSGNKNEPN